MKNERKVNFTFIDENLGKWVPSHGYTVNPYKKHVFDSEKDWEAIALTMFTIGACGQPKAFEDYWKWCEENNVPTSVIDGIKTYHIPNELAAKFYGEGPLWETPYSQGIVIREKKEDDYYVMLECSKNNPGWKYAKILLTPYGCWDKEGLIKFEEES